MTTLLMEKYIASFKNEPFIEKKYIDLQQKFQGLTGAGTAQLISNCVRLMNKNNVYLEIGVFQGANFVSVAHHNKDKYCIGVDNFSEHFEESGAWGDVSELGLVEQRIKKYDCKNAFIHVSDFREWIKNRTSLSKPIYVEVYFYDGPHSYQDQVDGVEMAFPLLADEAIIFIDDLASENTQKATQHLLKKYKDNLTLLLSTPNDCNKLGFQQGQAVLKYKRCS